MSLSRRRFHQVAAASAAGATLAGPGYFTQAAAQESNAASNVMTVALMGVNGRGTALAGAFMKQPNCRIAYVCDVDSRATERVVDLVEKEQKRKPNATADVRKVFDDKSIDILVCAAPNHWHAPATILGCASGKHVYVEKPCSHNAAEGEMAIGAARKFNRVVTMGSQRRSWPVLQEGIKKLHDGAIGRLMYARSWYNNKRGSIGQGKPSNVPDWLNYDLWQGPAPELPFKDNLIHYNWHWHWHWGNGELGNNGVHALDVARWGMQVDYPVRVASSGGRYRFQDDQETPDTHMVAFDFADRKTITWEGLSWSPLGNLQSGFGVSFHGEQGSMVIDGGGYKLLDLSNKEIESQSGAGSDSVHVANFLECIRTSSRPNADIEEAHKSTLLCHLGNIAHRVNRVLKTDPANGRVVDDTDAMALWGREYRSGWNLNV
jgi:predicted dehydrogenase